MEVFSQLGNGSTFLVFLPAIAAPSSPPPLARTEPELPGGTETILRQLAEQLRAQKPGLKVIFISGCSAEVIGEDTDFFQRTGSHFLQKPASARAILETVRRCLDEP